MPGACLMDDAFVPGWFCTLHVNSIPSDTTASFQTKIFALPALRVMRRSKRHLCQPFVSLDLVQALACVVAVICCMVFDSKLSQGVVTGMWDTRVLNTYAVAMTHALRVLAWLGLDGHCFLPRMALLRCASITSQVT